DMRTVLTSAPARMVSTSSTPRHNAPTLSKRMALSHDGPAPRSRLLSFQAAASTTALQKGRRRVFTRTGIRRRDVCVGLLAAPALLRSAFADERYAASTRRNLFQSAVAAPDLSTST